MRIVPCVAAILAATFTAAITLGQSPDDIRKKLESSYKLTKANYDKTDIVTAGDVIVLQKDKLLMRDTSSGLNPCKNTYNGKAITQSGPCAANEAAKKVSILTKHIPGVNKAPDTGKSHTYVTGEKLWLTKIEVKDKGVTLEFISDAIDNVRYGGSLSIPFTGSIPSPDDAAKLVSEVITVAPPDDKDAKNDKKSADQPAQAAAAAPAQAEAPPPPIEPPPPPPPADAPAPPTLEVGLTIDQVVAILGQPLGKAAVRDKTIYSYKDWKVTFVKGKVTEIQ